MATRSANARHAENGARIRRARHSTGLSLDNFAVAIGLQSGRRHLIRLEKGEHLPKAELRDRIVQVSGTEERIDADDDEEAEVLDALMAFVRRTKKLRQETGDPYALSPLK